MDLRFIKAIVFFSFFSCTISTISAQVVVQKVGDNPGVINASAVLEVESTNRGFLPPRMSTVKRDAIVSPALGLMIYNTTSNALEINKGTPESPLWTLTVNADLIGDVTSLGNTTTVGKINGIALSSLATGLLKNTAVTGVPSVATVRADYAEPTTGLLTGILKNTTGTGAHTIASAADFPILNQSTTGNAATVTTNANLTGEATSVGNAVTIVNAAVIGKTLTGFASAAGTISATDNILQAIQKLDGNGAIPGAVTIFASSGTYTPAAGVKWIIVECVGGGGAGGTTPSTTAANCAASGGGGGGGYRKVLITKAQLVGVSFAVTIGIGGTVSLAPGVGGTGGVSSLATFVSCNGGVGGAASVATASAIVSNGGAGGTSTSSGSFSINSLNGGNGETGYATTASTTRFFKGGNGGNSFLGFGGINNIAIAGNATTSTFIPSANYGGGGAGVAHTGTNTQRSGQAGSPGAIIITEFF